MGELAMEGSAASSSQDVDVMFRPGSERALRPLSVRRGFSHDVGARSSSRLEPGPSASSGALRQVSWRRLIDHHQGARPRLRRGSVAGVRRPRSVARRAIQRRVRLRECDFCTSRKVAVFEVSQRFQVPRTARVRARSARTSRTEKVLGTSCGVVTVGEHLDRRGHRPHECGRTYAEGRYGLDARCPASSHGRFGWTREDSCECESGNCLLEVWVRAGAPWAARGRAPWTRAWREGCR